MRDTLLEHTILRILCRHTSAIRQTVLAAEINIAIEGHEVTFNDFVDTLHRLENLNLISHTKDLLDYVRWKITNRGKTALKEIDYNPTIK